jgi:hypothetical protein
MPQLIRFRRLNRPATLVNGVTTHIWEIAFNEQDLQTKLNGDMAEVMMPAKPWYVRLWRWIFPDAGQSMSDPYDQ